MSQNEQIGRVLRASTTGFAVGCRVAQLQIPGFGGLVKAQPVDSREVVYGLIYQINIDDDPVVQRLVLAEDPPVEVVEDQRQNRLRPIEMAVLAVGYRRNGMIRHGLPPRPPLNLDPVELCQDEAEVRQFTDSLGYLRLILTTANLPTTQLLAAHIINVYELRGRDADWANKVIQEIIEQLRSNYDILIPTLEALSDALPDIGRSDL
ncbi:MAG: hypothetical protein KJ063_21270 [Anaerolineae bacterium]|nr:hypothetical protein [Anaerolineae bacterium]